MDDLSEKEGEFRVEVIKTFEYIDQSLDRLKDDLADIKKEHSDDVHELRECYTEKIEKLKDNFRDLREEIFGRSGISNEYENRLSTLESNAKSIFNTLNFYKKAFLAIIITLVGTILSILIRYALT